MRWLKGSPYLVSWSRKRRIECAWQWTRIGWLTRLCLAFHVVPSGSLRDEDGERSVELIPLVPPRPVTREKLSDACFPAAKRNDGGEGAFVSSVTEESTPFPSPIEAWVAASHMREVITSISERENVEIGSGDRRFHR